MYYAAPNFLILRLLILLQGSLLSFATKLQLHLILVTISSKHKYENIKIEGLIEIIQVETNFHVPELKPNNSYFEQKYSFLYFDKSLVVSIFNISYFEG